MFKELDLREAGGTYFSDGVMRGVLGANQRSI
jgi:hypothetical protein